jgi:hypothetical protein
MRAAGGTAPAWWTQTHKHQGHRAPLAAGRRLRPTGQDDDVQVLWSRGNAWATPDDFGPVIMSLNEALDFIATEDFFGIGA